MKPGSRYMSWPAGSSLLMEADQSKTDELLKEIPRWRGGSRLSSSSRILWDVLFDAGAEHDPVLVEEVIAEFTRRVTSKIGMSGAIIRLYNAKAQREGFALLPVSERGSEATACRWEAKKTLGNHKRSGRVDYDGTTVRILSYPKVEEGEYTPELVRQLRAETVDGHRRISRNDAFATALRGRTADELAEIIYLVITRMVRGSSDAQPARGDVNVRQLRTTRLVGPFIDSFDKRTDPSEFDVELLNRLIERWHSKAQIETESDSA